MSIEGDSRMKDGHVDVRKDVGRYWDALLDRAAEDVEEAEASDADAELNVEEAIKQWRRAAEYGDSVAMFNLGV